MPFSHTLDRLRVAFDEERLVANGGLLLPTTLAERIGVRDLVDELIDLGDVPGSANLGKKATTVTPRCSPAPTASMMSMSCERGAPRRPWGIGWPRRRRWAPSCACSCGATPDSSTP